MKADPITVDNPTPAEFKDAFNQLHRCIEAKGRSQDRRFNRLERLSKHQQLALEEIRAGLGVGDDRPSKHRTVATQTRRGAFWRTAWASCLGVTGAVTGLGVSVRLGIAVWPGLKATLEAIVHAMAAGKL